MSNDLVAVISQGLRTGLGNGLIETRSVGVRHDHQNLHGMDPVVVLSADVATVAGPTEARWRAPRLEGRARKPGRDCARKSCSEVLSTKPTPRPGGIRMFLLHAFADFLIPQWKRTHRVKRGGEMRCLPILAVTPDPV